MENSLAKKEKMDKPCITEGANVAGCVLCPGSQAAWGSAELLPVCGAVLAAV